MDAHTYVVWPVARMSSGARWTVKVIDSEVRPAATGRTWVASRSVRVAPRWWSQPLAAAVGFWRDAGASRHLQEAESLSSQLGANRRVSFPAPLDLFQPIRKLETVPGKKFAVTAAAPSRPGLPIRGHAWSFYRQPLQLLRQAAAAGDAVTIRRGIGRAILVSHPT